MSNPTTQKPVQGEIEQILTKVDSLRALTLSFEYHGVKYSLDRDQTRKVIASGVYRYLWSKYQAKVTSEEKEEFRLMKEELLRRGVDLKSLKTS